MNRQYHAHRRQSGDNPLGVGTIALGSVFYIQDRGYWEDRFRGRAVCRNPWIVEAFLNGELCAASRDLATGHWRNVFLGNRTDTALVRSLRDGRRKTVAIRMLQMLEEHGLTMGEARYPSLPELRLHPQAQDLMRPATPARRTAA